MQINEVFKKKSGGGGGGPCGNYYTWREKFQKKWT